MTRKQQPAINERSTTATIIAIKLLELSSSTTSSSGTNSKMSSVSESASCSRSGSVLLQILSSGSQCGYGHYWHLSERIVDSHNGST